MGKSSVFRWAASALLYFVLPLQVFLRLSYFGPVANKSTASEVSLLVFG